MNEDQHEREDARVNATEKKGTGEIEAMDESIRANEAIEEKEGIPASESTKESIVNIKEQTESMKEEIDIRLGSTSRLNTRNIPAIAIEPASMNIETS